MGNYLFAFYSSYGISVMWITVFSSAYKLLDPSCSPITGVHMSWYKWYPQMQLLISNSSITLMVIQIYMWGHVRDRRWIIFWLQGCWLFISTPSLGKTFLSSWSNQSLKISRLRRANRECFPVNYSWVLQPRNFFTSNNLQYTVYDVLYTYTYISLMTN